MLSGNNKLAIARGGIKQNVITNDPDLNNATQDEGPCEFLAGFFQSGTLGQR